MEFCPKCYSFDELIDVVEEVVPLLFMFLAVFVFILFMHRTKGKSRSLYWFILVSLFIFDLVTLGLSASYLDAVSHGFCCKEEDL